jgi:hypothetical protein
MIKMEEEEKFEPKDSEDYDELEQFLIEGGITYLKIKDKELQITNYICIPKNKIYEYIELYKSNDPPTLECDIINKKTKEKLGVFNLGLLFGKSIKTEYGILFEKLND